MEFWIRRASSSGYIWEGEDIERAEKPCKSAYTEEVAGNHHRFKINIESIEDLISLQEETGYNLVIGIDYIIIYDDYIE